MGGACRGRPESKDPGHLPGFLVKTGKRRGKTEMKKTFGNEERTVKKEVCKITVVLTTVGAGGRRRGIKTMEIRWEKTGVAITTKTAKLDTSTAGEIDFRWGDRGKWIRKRGVGDREFPRFMKRVEHISGGCTVEGV